MYRERLEILRNWREYVERIKEAAAKLLGSCEVYVFGSAVTGRLTAASDIDVLIVTEDLSSTLRERAAIKDAIERLAGLPPYHPIQMHLRTREEVERSPIYLEVTKQDVKIG